MRNRTRAFVPCCRHNLRRLVSTPRVWAVLVLTALYIENQFAPIRDMLVDEGLTISWFGLTVYMLNDASVTMMMGLGLLMLLIDAPFTDETQRYIVARTGRGAWGRGQIAYMLCMTALYLAAFVLLILCFQAPWTDWSAAWSEGIERLVLDGAYEYYNTMLEYDPWLVRVFTPLSGALLVLSLHALAFGLLALLQYAVNVLIGGRLGFLIAAAPLLLDAVIEEYFPVLMYYFSPVTLSRLSTLDYGDDMGRPPIWYAFIVLGVLTAAFMLWCARLSKRKEISL